MVSANPWLRGIKTNRLSWHLTRVSANHASSNWVQEEFTKEKKKKGKTFEMSSPFFLIAIHFHTGHLTLLQCHRVNAVLLVILRKTTWTFIVTFPSTQICLLAFQNAAVDT